MCTGTAIRPHLEGAMEPAATATCACALRDHRPKSLGTKPEPTRFPPLPDGWAGRARLRSQTPRPEAGEADR